MPQSMPKGLVGDAPEVKAFVNNVQCDALMDTGSQVTSVCQTFYEKNLANVPNV